MALAKQILESLWGMGVPEETLRGVKATGGGAMRAELRRRGVTDEQIDRATALADWRPSKDQSSRQALGALLRTMGIPQETIDQIIRRVAQNPDGSPRTYTDADLIRSASEALGPQVGTNLAIKIQAPTAIPAGGPAWNPFRGDAPKGTPAAMAATAPAAPGAPPKGPGRIVGPSRPEKGLTPGAAPRTPAPGGEIPAGVPTDKAGVMNLQRLLNARGAGLKVDGVYGPRTRAAHQQHGRGTTTAPGQTLGTTAGETLAGPGPATPAPAPAAPPPLSPTASDAEVEAYIRKNYGFAAWVLDVPDIRGAIVDVARSLGGAPIDEASIDSMVETRLLQTDWWKTHNATQRVRIEERHEDPAAYNAGIDAEFRNLGALVGQIGFAVPEGRLREIARQSYEFGWNPAEQRSALAAEFDYSPETGSQAVSRVVTDLRDRAAKYLVPLSEATIDEWGRKVVAGTAAPDAIDGYLREQAKVLLPGFATQIDAGLTPDQLVEPYRQTIARELGSDPTAVDFLDPRWNRFLNSPDPKTNAPRVMSHFEIQRTIRTDPTYNWDQSEVARREATEFATQLAQRFGRAG